MENVRVSTTRFVGTAGITQIVRGSKLTDYLEVYAKLGTPSICVGDPETDHMMALAVGTHYQPLNAFNADMHMTGAADEVLVIMDTCSDTFITYLGIPLFDESGNQLYLQGYGCNIKGSKPQPLTPPVFE